jgi:predicted Zn finger-like uncharacterized protein
MPIRIACPGCKAAYSVPDEHRGKKLRCKKCDRVFRIETAAAPAPADTVKVAPTPRTKRPDLDFQDGGTEPTFAARSASPRKSGMSPVVLIVGAIAGLLFLGGGAVGAYFLFKDPKPVIAKPAEQDPTGIPIRNAASIPGEDVPKTTSSGSVATGTFSTAYISDEFFVVLVVQPSQLIKSPLLAALPQEKLLGEVIKQAGFDPRKLSQVIIAMDPGPKVQMGRHSPSVIARFQEPIDGRKLLEPLMGPFTEKQHNGKTYLVSAAVGATYLPDNRTIVIAPEATLHKMMAASGGGTGPLAKKLAALDMKAEAVGVFLTAPARELLGEAMKEVPKDIPPQLAGVTSLPDRVDAAVLKLNLTGPTLLDLRLETKNPESTAEVHKLLQAGVEMITQFAPLFQQGIQKDAPPPLGPPLAAVLDQAVKGIVVKAEGNQASLSVKMPQGLPDLVAKAGPMLAELIPGGGAAPGSPPGERKGIEKPTISTKGPPPPPTKIPDKSPFDNPGRPPFDKGPPSKESPKPRGDASRSPVDKASRAQALEWVRTKNAFGPEHKLVADTKADLDSMRDDSPGFFFELGPDLVKSKKPTWLLGWQGEFHVFELRPDQGAKIAKNNMRRTTLNPLNDLGMVKKDFTIEKPIFDGGTRLTLDKEVTGKLPFRNLGRTSEDYLSVRMVYWEGNERVIQYWHYLSKFVTKDDKEFRFKFPQPRVQGPGPILFVLDIVEFDNEQRTGEPFVVSNPVVVLVDIAAAK